MTDNRHVEHVRACDKTLAVILRSAFAKDGVSFVTDPADAFQLGVLQHRQGKEIKAHVHRATVRTIDNVQEMLHIVSGRVQVDFYLEDGTPLQTDMLGPGDTLLILSGGHGFKVLDDAKIIEVKQGPYYGVEQDKEFLQPK